MANKDTNWQTGPFNPKYDPCNPIHFEPPREVIKPVKPNPWMPTMKSVSNGYYKQSMNFIDKQPPKPLPKYTKIFLKPIQSNN
jgi:hypothetical protein